MKINFQGNGSALGSSCAKACFVVDDSIMVDAGADPGPALRAADIDPNDIKILALTHLHGDHFFGGVFLVAEAMLTSGREPLHVLGPEGTEQAIRDGLKLAYPVSNPDDFLAKANVTFNTVVEGLPIRIAGYEFTPFRVDHGRMLAFGYRLRSPDQTQVVFTGDGKVDLTTEKNLTGCDAVVANCPTRDKPLPAHAAVNEYLGLRQSSSDPKLRAATFYFTHRTFDEISSESLKYPADGESFTINSPING